jgi:catechol 2,3-dioxygenase-like lactoylglutathione lyase family enzyme
MIPGVRRHLGGAAAVRDLAAAGHGGGPTPDKPEVTFAPPADPAAVSHAMTIRVPDCRAAYETLLGRGAEFLTPPVDYEWEVRCFFRDPDGHLLEISESKPPAGGS